MSALHISVSPEVIGHLGPLPVTNSLFTSVLTVLVLLFISYKVNRQKPDKKDCKRGNWFLVFEMIIEGFYNFFQRIAGSRTDRLFPLLFTFFLFIIISNWIGLLPGVGSIGFYEQSHGSFIPLLRGPNADLNTTLALALISVGMTQYLSIQSLGFKSYVDKFVNLKNPIGFFVGILELVSEFAKILSFSFRLFGNIFAGEVLLVVMFFLVPLIVPVPFLALEIFVGFIQALVFTMLTTIFVVVATEKHH